MTAAADHHDRTITLTAAERRVADLAGQAMTNRQIASQLTISHHTVNYHLRNIYRKLGIQSRVQLARINIDAH